LAADPRQIRTRAALKAALLRLATDESVVTASVATLCKEAGVHRTTFYGHANSLEEFAVDVLSEDIDAITAVEFDPANPVQGYLDALVNLLEQFKDKRPVFRPLFASPWLGAMVIKMNEYMLHRAELALDSFSTLPGISVPQPHREAAAYVAGALVASCVEWVKEEDDDSHAKARRIQALMPPWWPKP
jgi:AcrR family transcriptional regulator